MAENENKNTKVALTYLLGFLTGIYFLLTEKKSELVRFHAMQSTITFGGLFVISVVLGWIPFLGFFLANLVSLAGFVLWLLLIWKTYKGEDYRLPYVGKLAEKQLLKLKSKG